MPPSTEEDYHQINDVANKAILQELIENSGDEVTAEILKCYKIGASDTDIKKDFSRWKVAPLRNTATYLLVETEGKLKADIINDVISKIEALFMEVCTVCSKYYHNSLEDVPVYTCIVCQQGCHQPCYEEVFNALQTLDPKYQNSMQFICSSCQRVYQPQQNTEAAANTNPSKVKKSPTKTPVEDKENPVNKSFEENKEPPEEEADQPSENTDICPEYKWKKCSNYNQCKYKHPPRCKDLLRDGKCRYKKKCKFHHPPLCRYSLKERKCLNHECKFFHIAKTLRHNPDEQKTVANENHTPQPPQPSHDQPNNSQHIPNHPPAQPLPSLPIQPINTNSKQVNQTSSVDQTNNYLPFLLTMMKQLKEDLLGHLGREIADLKQNIIPNRSPQMITQASLNQTLPSSQQVLFNPLLQGMSVKPQLVHHQQSSC